jgi:hypothetical protein
LEIFNPDNIPLLNSSRDSDSGDLTLLKNLHAVFLLKPSCTQGLMDFENRANVQMVMFEM